MSTPIACAAGYCSIPVQQECWYLIFVIFVVVCVVFLVVVFVFVVDVVVYVVIIYFKLSLNWVSNSWELFVGVVVFVLLLFLLLLMMIMMMIFFFVFVVVIPKNIRLKFGQNQVSNWLNVVVVIVVVVVVIVVDPRNKALKFG